MRKKILKNKNPLCSTKQLRLTFVERKKKISKPEDNRNISPEYWWM